MNRFGRVLGASAFRPLYSFTISARTPSSSFKAISLIAIEGILCSEHFHLNASNSSFVTSLAGQVAGLGHRGNTTTAVIDLYDTNTITMVAREICSMAVHLKKGAERMFKVM